VPQQATDSIGNGIRRVIVGKGLVRARARVESRCEGLHDGTVIGGIFDLGRHDAHGRNHGLY
jgi:hypothetical protein